ncbi:prolyl 4-hydroxylase subunit alpha-3 [Pithys albifrons albifrons]|uniref:prolyl 4-hydroxylase subunit alpha-3 n=1 Tax=Pithys albifrons albifrons TaxID=3385563 RepID=UPI003A5CEE8C
MGARWNRNRDRQNGGRQERDRRWVCCWDWERWEYWKYWGTWRTGDTGVLWVLLALRVPGALRALLGLGALGVLGVREALGVLEVLGALGALGILEVLWVLGALLALLPSPAPAETFSAMLSVRGALGAERSLLRQLRSYLREESARLRRLRRFYEKVQALHQDPKASMDNPLLAFSLIKRLHSEWPNIIYSIKATGNAQALHASLQDVEQELPGAEDLDGSAWALMCLQDFYALNVKALANGIFQASGATHLPLYSPSRRVSLSADDCFHVGKVAYDTGDYYHSITWLEEAVSLFRLSYGSWNPEDRSSLEDALDHLAFSYFMAGNISHALSLSRDFLHYDPSNQRVTRNVAKYEKLLKMGTGTSITSLRRPNSTNLQSQDTYEELCQRPRGQPVPERFLYLDCAYETKINPYLLLQPAKKEIVRIQPYVALYHYFVSDTEAETIVGKALGELQRSVVTSGEKQQKAEYWISKSAWLKDTADPVVRALDRRIAAITGLDLWPPYAEYLQVVNYGLGGHYEPHFDHATSRKSPLYRMNSGNRITTVMIYLSAVEAGGSTAFISANFSAFGCQNPVSAPQNAALFWWNLQRNGNGDGDTLHAGCPVLAGDKWVANKWIHEYGQEFWRPCGANPWD